MKYLIIFLTLIISIQCGDHTVCEYHKRGDCAISEGDVDVLYGIYTNQSVFGTGCRTDDEGNWRFYTIKKNSKKLVIYLRSGGACWDETYATCDCTKSSPARCDPSVPGVPTQYFPDYNIIGVPYCSGDVHTGNNIVNYTDTLQIRHLGLNNTLTTFDYMYDNYGDMEEVILTGCSAGSIGTMYHAYHLIENLKAVNSSMKITILPIGYLGHSPSGFHGTDHTIWNSCEFYKDMLPTWYQSCLSKEENILQKLIKYNTNKYPDVWWGIESSYNDSVQIGFSNRMFNLSYDADYADNIVEEMIFESITDYNKCLNYSVVKTFTPHDETHCLDNYASKADVNGLEYHEWMHKIINREEDIPSEGFIDSNRECSFESSSVGSSDVSSTGIDESSTGKDIDNETNEGEGEGGTSETTSNASLLYTTITCLLCIQKIFF